MEVLKLNAEEVLDIQPVTGNGDPLFSKASANGKTPSFPYRNFSYNGIVFNVKDSNGFWKAIEEEPIFSVTLLKTTQEKDIAGKKTIVPAYQFGGFVTAKKKLGVVDTLGQIRQREMAYAKPMVITAPANNISKPTLEEVI
jgi:hypothetical protein